MDESKYCMVLIVCMLYILTGCIPHRRISSSSCSVWREEALLYDVPVLLGAKPDTRYEYKEGDCDLVIAYNVTSTQDKVVAFYTEQMELYGWHHQGSIYGAEVLLLFEKPQSCCVVVIRSQKLCQKDEKQQLTIVIFRGVYF